MKPAISMIVPPGGAPRLTYEHRAVFIRAPQRSACALLLASNVEQYMSGFMSGAAIAGLDPQEVTVLIMPDHAAVLDEFPDVKAYVLARIAEAVGESMARCGS